MTATEKQALHKAIKRLNPHLSMPSPGEEARDLDYRDQRYDRATAWLCNQTRDTEKLPLILAENVSYGFARNLLPPTGLPYTLVSGLFGCAPDPGAYSAACISGRCEG